MATPVRLLISSGEPAGIGPELTIRLAQQRQPFSFAVIADPVLLQQRAAMLNMPLHVHPVAVDEPWPTSSPGQLNVVALPLAKTSLAGVLENANADYVLHMLTMAGQAALNHNVDAIVTAPVHKGVINEAGVAFQGHTEFFAALAGNVPVLMLLACKGLRVALLTTHMPLRAVADAVTPERLEHTLRLFHRELRQKFALSSPRIAVLGLNPHAGEGGHMGREEIDVIQPVMARLQSEGMALLGPVSADTAFTDNHRQRFDAVLAMYHDQGLPVLKTLGFYRSVNITLGLPFIRTSVDHGTALDIAARGIADAGSLQYACEQAVLLANASR